MNDRLSRALPTLAILAVVSLLLSQGLTWLTVERAADAADRGEVEALARSVESALSRSQGPPSNEMLEAVLAAHETRGLVYLAALGRGEWRSAGKAIVEGAPLGPGLTRHGAFLRHVSEPPPPRREPPPPGGRPPELRGPEGPPHERPLLVIDARPFLGAKLHADTRITVLAAALASSLFVVLAYALRRSQLAHEAVLQERASEKRLAALGEMASVLSHEIRNPLASLKGHAQLLGESLAEDERGTKKIARIVSEAERLERLTTELLEFVGTPSLQKETVDLSALVHRAADEVPEGRFEIRGLEASADFYGDESRIYQVLLNILRNAAQAAPGQVVEVSLGETAKALEVRVRDRGPGLPPGNEARVFDPFFTTRVKGTGLGLSIAQQLVERHGGSLTAENAADGGAVFCIVLPKGEGTK